MTKPLLGMMAVFEHLKGSQVERRAYWNLVLGLIGVGSSLPFFGIELFALRDVSQAAIPENAASLMALGQSIRYGLGVYFFFIGLLLIAIAAIVWATVLWSCGTLPKWIGVPLGVGLALIIPQFFTPQPVRVAHGLLLGLGCVWVVRCLLKHPRNQIK